jgi:hypothetical protein
MSAAARRAQDDAALAAVDARLAAAPCCDRCGIRKPHVCTKDSLAHLAVSRSGAGFSPPLIDDIERAPAEEYTESLRQAALRIGVHVAILREAAQRAGLAPKESGRWRHAPAAFDAALTSARAAGVTGRTDRRRAAAARRGRG